MDELTIRSKFTTGLICKIVKKIAKKKLGVEISLNIYELEASISDVDGNAKIHIDANIDIPKNELHYLIMKNL